MDMTPKEYQAYVKAKAPSSPIVRDCLRAFLVGGLICTLGQAIQNGWLAAGLTKDDAGAATASSPSRASPTPWSPPPSTSRPRGSSPAWPPRCSPWRGR